MKVTLIGATGYVGSRMMIEALQRGHEVTAIARHPERLPPVPQLHPVRADVFDREAIATLVAGHDAVIDAFHPGWDTPLATSSVSPSASRIAGNNASSPIFIESA